MMYFLSTMTFLILFIIFHLCICNTKSEISGKIWGPGLYPDKTILPARYLFLELYNNTELYYGDVKMIQFKVTAKSVLIDKPCRIWYQVLDRKDGTYILRYKLYETCKDMIISVKYDNVDLDKSPYIIADKIIYDENTESQSKSTVAEWLLHNECGSVPLQITEDLSVFKSIDWSILRSKVLSAYDKPHSISICHYIIKNNEIYRKCYGKYVGFKMFSDNILLSLTRKMYLPDTEFFINLGDWPLVLKKMEHKLPVISWCGSDDTYDIVLPTYDITESTLENMGRVMLDMLSVQANTKLPWEKRENMGFWRGRDSNIYRLKLIDIARQNPDLINASITNFFNFRDQIDKYGPKSEHISLYDFFNYKYQINIDGTVAAYRLPYLLAGKSVVFKQKSDYYEHFYKQLIANVHYIEVQENLSDLVDKIKWAKENDDVVQEIAHNAYEFINKNLLPLNILCYHVHLFNEYSKLISSDINILENMEKVEQPQNVVKINMPRDEL